MSFNWPNLEFSGSEVDAFVLAYKELAESITTDYENHSVPLTDLHGPYRRSVNIKILLEKALMYSAFIIKQRAGNTGPGTDFDLENSPNIINIQLKELIENMGCTFTYPCMLLALQNYISKNPNFPLKQEDLESKNNPLWDLLEAMSKDDLINFSNKWGGLDDGAKTSFLGDLMKLYTATLGEIVPNEVLGGHTFAATLLSLYLGSNTGQVTATDLEQQNPGLVNKIKNDIQLVLNDGRGVTTLSDNPVDWGGDPGDTVVSINFHNSIGTLYSYSLGTAKVVVGQDGSPKIVRDDFDFKYGWETDRSGTGTKPGDFITDSMIVTGVNRLDNNGNPIQNVTIDEALSGSAQGAFNKWVRYPAAAAYGNGSYANYSDHPNPSGAGRPFGIYISF